MAYNRGFKGFKNENNTLQSALVHFKIPYIINILEQKKRYMFIVFTLLNVLLFGKKKKKVREWRSNKSLINTNKIIILKNN